MRVRVGYLEDRGSNYEAVVFAGSDGEGLAIERPMVPDAQDIAMGLDTYSLSLTSGPTVYGGVTEWHRGIGTVTLQLTAQAADDLGVPQLLRLDVGQEQLEVVLPHLSRILG